MASWPSSSPAMPPPVPSAGTLPRACPGCCLAACCSGTSTAARSRPTWAWAIERSASLAGVSADASRTVPDPPSLVALIAQGVLDAELAALVWVLVEGRIPLVIAAPEGRAGAGGQLLAGILASVHAGEATDAVLAPLTAVGASSLVRGRRAGGVLEAGSL